MTPEEIADARKLLQASGLYGAKKLRAALSRALDALEEARRGFKYEGDVAAQALAELRATQEKLARLQEENLRWQDCHQVLKMDYANMEFRAEAAEKATAELKALIPELELDAYGSAVLESKARAEAAEKRAGELERALKAISVYNPPEVCKDDFAYDRLLEVIHEAARAALSTPSKEGT